MIRRKLASPIGFKVVQGKLCYAQPAYAKRLMLELVDPSGLTVCPLREYTSVPTAAELAARTTEDKKAGMVRITHISLSDLHRMNSHVVPGIYSGKAYVGNGESHEDSDFETFEITIDDQTALEWSKSDRAGNPAVLTGNTPSKKSPQPQHAKPTEDSTMADNTKAAASKPPGKPKQDEKENKPAHVTPEPAASGTQPKSKVPEGKKDSPKADTNSGAAPSGEKPASKPATADLSAIDQLIVESRKNRSDILQEIDSAAVKVGTLVDDKGKEVIAEVHASKAEILSAIDKKAPAAPSPVAYPPREDEAHRSHQSWWQNTITFCIFAVVVLAILFFGCILYKTTPTTPAPPQPAYPAAAVASPSGSNPGSQAGPGDSSSDHSGIKKTSDAGIDRQVVPVCNTTIVYENELKPVQDTKPATAPNTVAVGQAASQPVVYPPNEPRAEDSQPATGELIAGQAGAPAIVPCYGSTECYDGTYWSYGGPNLRIAARINIGRPCTPRKIIADSRSYRGGYRFPYWARNSDSARGPRGFRHR